MFKIRAQIHKIREDGSIDELAYIEDYPWHVAPWLRVWLGVMRKIPAPVEPCEGQGELTWS